MSDSESELSNYSETSLPIAPTLSGKGMKSIVSTPSDRMTAATSEEELSSKKITIKPSSSRKTKPKEIIMVSL